MVASFALLLTVSCPNKFPVAARPASYAAQVAEPGEAREVRAIEDQRALQLPAAALRQLAVGSDVVVGRVDHPATVISRSEDLKGVFYLR